MTIEDKTENPDTFGLKNLAFETSIRLSDIGICMAIGCMGGEIIDWIPYVNEIIPYAIASIGNAFTDTDTTHNTKSYLIENVDKVGTLAGFIAGMANCGPCRSSYDSYLDDTRAIILGKGIIKFGKRN
ncbi:MAG: hypothetical protein RL557_473 [archaeon]|jgi:hypothetical protein